MLKRVREKFMDSATFICNVVTVVVILFAVSIVIDELFDLMVNILL